MVTPHILSPADKNVCWVNLSQCSAEVIKMNVFSQSELEKVTQDELGEDKAHIKVKGCLHQI